VVAQLREAYEGKYKIRDFEYVGQSMTITMICPVHGDFEKKLYNALYSKTGCQKCGGRLSSKERTTTVLSNYPQYKFPRLEYHSMTAQLVAVCKIHKHEFSYAFTTFYNKKQEHPCSWCRKEANDERIYQSNLEQYSSDRAGYKDYTRVVRRHTNHWFKQSKQYRDGHRRTLDLHIDHAYSISDGWQNGILPEIVGHITNLRLLDGVENQRKSAKSVKTKKQLLADYKRYEKEQK